MLHHADLATVIISACHIHTDETWLRLAAVVERTHLYLPNPHCLNLAVVERTHLYLPNLHCLNLAVVERTHLYLPNPHCLNLAVAERTHLYLPNPHCLNLAEIGCCGWEDSSLLAKSTLFKLGCGWEDSSLLAKSTLFKLGCCGWEEWAFSCSSWLLHFLVIKSSCWPVSAHHHLLLQLSTALQVRSSVCLMPQNQLSSRGLLPGPTAWSAKSAPCGHVSWRLGIFWAGLKDISGVWSAWPHSVS